MFNTNLEREKQERVGTARPIRVRLTPARHPQSCLPPSRRDVRKPAAFIYPDDAFAQHYTATTALNAQCGGGAPKSRKKVPRAVTLNRCRGAIKLWRRKPCRLHRSKRKLVVGRWALPQVQFLIDRYGRAGALTGGEQLGALQAWRSTWGKIAMNTMVDNSAPCFGHKTLGAWK